MRIEFDEGTLTLVCENDADRSAIRDAVGVFARNGRDIEAEKAYGYAVTQDEDDLDRIHVGVGPAWWNYDD